MTAPSLIQKSIATSRSLCACPECDLLHRREPLAAGAACCRRCGAVLYHAKHASIDTVLALASAAAILLVLANAFPLVELQLNGDRTHTTLVGAVLALDRQGMPLLALLVGATTLVLPWFEVVLIGALLLPMRAGRRPRWLGGGFRLLRALRPWSMTEIFLLGILVSLAKLGALAQVLVGPGLWCLIGLIVTLAWLAAHLKPETFWSWAESTPAEAAA